MVALPSGGLRARVRAGEVVIGTMVFEFASPGLPVILANAGAEFAVYDMEHGGFGIETIKMLIAAGRGTSLVPLVRVPAAEYHLIAPVLDAGAHGIMVPTVESADQAAQMVAAAKYPPRGRRGAAFGFAHDGYSGGDVGEKVARLNERTLVIAMVETERGLANVDGILGTEGVDVCWIGHFDLSVSLGIPGQFDHPHFAGAVTRILAACRTHDVAAGFMVTDPAAGHDWIARGGRVLAYSGDMFLLADALRAGIGQTRRLIRSGGN